MCMCESWSGSISTGNGQSWMVTGFKTVIIPAMQIIFGVSQEKRDVSFCYSDKFWGKKICMRNRNIIPDLNWSKLKLSHMHCL